MREPLKKKRICSFLWSYYGYPTSTYEGLNVEAMRYINGRIMADNDKENLGELDIDYVGGVPDSGTPHAIGYANQSGKPFARAFIKYTPTWSRSFMPARQTDRNKIAKMKQIPVYDLIKDKNLLFVDDSIVRGTRPSSSSTKTARRASICAPPARRSCSAASSSTSPDRPPIWS